MTNNNEHPVDGFCRHELELFERRLSDLEAGRLKVGTSTGDGLWWIDTTADEIARAQVRTAELRS